MKHTPDRQAVDTCKCGCTVYRQLPEGDRYFMVLCRIHKSAPALLAALEDLHKELRASRKLSVKQDYSLMVADAEAVKAINMATGKEG